MTVPASIITKIVGSVPRGSRRYDALRFIVEHIVRERSSPSFDQIATGLNLGKTRARTLVRQLMNEGLVSRPIGAQRAIAVPGLDQYIAVEKLREIGWLIDEDIRFARRPPAGPYEHLPLVAVIEHRVDYAEPSDPLPAASAGHSR